MTKKKFLGIDFGDKRVGLALAEDKGPALPFKVIPNDSKLVASLQEIIKQENITAVVVGLPHSFSGQENERMFLTKKFVEILQHNLSIEVYTIDEQFTSKLYEKMGVTKDLDKHAATAILDTYLIK